MERCYACGGELPPQARFCSRCGAGQDELARNDEQTRISNLQRERLPQAAILDMVPPALADGPTTPATYPSGTPGVPRPNTFSSLTGTPPLTPATPQGWPQAAGQFGPRTDPGRAPHAAGGKAAGGATLKWALVLTAAIVVVGGVAGTLAYVLTRPQPLVVLHSPYHVGSTPAGSAGTTLQFVGQHFAGNSAITFLLDGQHAPGAGRVSSDSQGSVSANLPITAAWPQGRHVLSARDAGGTSPQVGAAVEIVAQGEAHTPGPSGAPPNDASFQVSIQLRGTYSQGGGAFSGSDTEIVTGRPDPAGGHVCQPQDDGQPHQYTSHTLDTGLPETQTIVYACAGTYRGGVLTLTETILSDTVQLNDHGVPTICHLLHPGVDEQLNGTYSAQGTFHGTVTYPGIPRANFSCNNGLFSFYFFLYSGSGTWTGTVSTL